MTVRELREKYLQFFKSKEHDVFPSGSLIPVDVTGRLDESLLFNGAGMVQFKPYFRGIAEPPNRRLTTAQKCVRTGDIETAGDLTHLTFFEMMGNFSFGDYFKAQAIAFSWEFITEKKWLGLDPKRCAFTVFEEDDDAYAEWERWLIPAGINPEERIFRLGEDANYWPAGAYSAGPPGPCGPNSEMFYWTSKTEPPPSGPYTREDFLRDEGDGKWLEFWNDVFIQFDWQGHHKNPERPDEGYVKDGMPPLPFQSVDTGLGIERAVTVINGEKDLYLCDSFTPIMRKLEEVSGGKVAYGKDPVKDTAMRIIADHIRTAVFCIADGVLPGNTGRGYVLRRLIRRAVLKGQRALGFEKPFFHRVFEGVVEAMGDHYKELDERSDVIVETLKNEEALFRRTLIQGTSLFNEVLARVQGGLSKHFPGDQAFMLYDTYGFPLEVTEELASEAGISVENSGYEAAMKEAQERSRASGAMDTVYGGVEIKLQFGGLEGGLPVNTQFLGYEALGADARVVGVLPQVDEHGKTTGEIAIALDRTPFYAESGGQTSDQGLLVGDSFELRVIDMFKHEGVFVHLSEPLKGISSVEGLTPPNAAKTLNENLMGALVKAFVNSNRRRSIQRNHTATHLLHAALRSVLGKHVTQAGSYVGPDRLRFDFTHGKALSPNELAEVERIVNEQTLANTPVVTYADIPIAEAKKRGAMALFGEKYGNVVRMVEIGEFSRELCGGTHVWTTGEIGFFKIMSEASAASGVRRIEAVTGDGAYQWALEEARLVKEAAQLLKSSPAELPQAVAALQDQLREEKKKREKAEGALVKGTSSGAADKDDALERIGTLLFWAPTYQDLEPKIVAASVDERASSKPNLVAVAAVLSNCKVNFICRVGPGAQALGLHAGDIVREVAQIAGGGGGGRPDFATAGGKFPNKVGEAIARAREIVVEKASL